MADLDVVPGLLRLAPRSCRRWRPAGGRRWRPAIRSMSIGWVSAAGDRLDRDHALLGGLVGERRPADEVADRVDLRVRRPLVVVDLDPAVLLGLDLGLGEVRGPPCRARGRRRCTRYSTSSPSSPTFTLTDFEPSSTASTLVPVETLIPCFLKVRSTTRAQSLSSSGQDLVEHLDQDHLGAVAGVGRGDLGARGAGADDRERFGSAGSDHAPQVSTTRSENSTPGIGERHRAGGEDHRAGLVGLAADGHVAVGGRASPRPRSWSPCSCPRASSRRPRGPRRRLARRSPSAFQSSAAPLTFDPELGAVRRRGRRPRRCGASSSPGCRRS